jgi:hypothetical protein
MLAIFPQQRDNIYTKKVPNGNPQPFNPGHVSLPPPHCLKSFQDHQQIRPLPGAVILKAFQVQNKTWQKKIPVSTIPQEMIWHGGWRK